ncbi:MAG: hypothetical protein ACR2FV_16200 [Ornithinimicrobium sp.]|uniref:hypothetical protein n=1 Tax=Ornithinimicrobium sp. TaxID=1977084 RepID=UPI003D9BBCC3
MPPPLPSATTDAKATTFTTALRSLGPGDKQRVTFESPTGEAGPTLVQRSRRALVLVVGSDESTDPEVCGGIAAYCVARAHCQVHVVASRQPPVNR